MREYGDAFILYALKVKPRNAVFYCLATIALILKIFICDDYTCIMPIK